MTATAVLPNPPAPPATAPGPLVLEGVSWETYEMLLHDLQEQHFSITYDRGRMVLMSPLPTHEGVKKLTGRMIEALSLELSIPIKSLGSTTWRRRDLLRGLEPDECYYVQSEPKVRGRYDIELPKDPPPDLALEVENTHHPLDRIGIYAALGVPEVWHWAGGHYACLVLNARGEYEPREFSLAFPFLKPAEFEPFLAMSTGTDETSLTRAFRDWVRQSKTFADRPRET